MLPDVMSLSHSSITLSPCILFRCVFLSLSLCTARGVRAHIWGMFTYMCVAAGHNRTAESIREKWRKMVLKDPALEALGADIAVGVVDSEKTPPTAADDKKEGSGRADGLAAGSGETTTEGKEMDEQADREEGGGKEQEEDKVEEVGGLVIADDTEDEQGNEEGDEAGKDDVNEMPPGMGEGAGAVGATVAD